MIEQTELIVSSATFSIGPLFFTTQYAHFYIDVGTGSLVLQVLVASFVGGLFLTKVYWRKMKAFVRRSLFKR